MNLSRLTDSIKLHEGFSAEPYFDSKGILTIGYGTNLEEGISEYEAEFLLNNRLANAVRETRALVDNFSSLSDARQEVLVEMCYQMGSVSLAGFKKMLAAIKSNNHAVAAHEMLDSKWAKIDTPKRAEELALIYARG